MGIKKNIERNKLDYLLTDIMPVEVSELFSYGKFYEYLLGKSKELHTIVEQLQQEKNKKNALMFNGGPWAAIPLKYNVLKGINGSREINLPQPISALNICFFIECYQKELLNSLENNACFSLRYHKKNNDLFYRRKTNSVTEYFYATYKKIDKTVLQQTGAYFKIHKFNSVSAFCGSRLWQDCNFKYRYFAKVDYKSCFDSIYTHVYKWIIERNTVDSKEANNSNLYITIDRILQNINGKSSNGVIVGPEFSRMIAEILLQKIDVEIKQQLLSQGIRNGKDYRFFRYVDDMFIFTHTPIILENILSAIEVTANQYLLHINELKNYRTETPVVLNEWIEKTRALADKISCLFNKKRDIGELTERKFLIKNDYISLDRLKDDFSILMTQYPNDRRFISSFILSTLLNNICNKKDGYKLFDENKTGKAYVILELAFFVYSFCPCFEHSQKIISMLVYFEDEVGFKNSPVENKKLQNLIRRYSFIFEKANLNDICNWFIVFNEYHISLLQQSEITLIDKLDKEDNPILWANFLIYSRYDAEFNKKVQQTIELHIEDSLNKMLMYEPKLQREIWYAFVFCNCPTISKSTKLNISNMLVKLKSNGTSPCEKANNLVYDFLSCSQLNLFFYWGYSRFSASKQITYRTYQRTLFKQYKNRTGFEMFGSIDV